MRIEDEDGGEGVDAEAAGQRVVPTGAAAGGRPCGESEFAEGLHGVVLFFVEADGGDGDAVRGEAAGKFGELGEPGDGGRRPSGPENEDDDASALGGEGEFAPLNGGEGEVGFPAEKFEALEVVFEALPGGVIAGEEGGLLEDFAFTGRLVVEQRGGFGEQAGGTAVFGKTGGEVLRRFEDGVAGVGGFHGAGGGGEIDRLHRGGDALEGGVGAVFGRCGFRALERGEALQGSFDAGAVGERGAEGGHDGGVFEFRIVAAGIVRMAVEELRERFFLGQQVAAGQAHDFFRCVRRRDAGAFLQGLDLRPDLVGGLVGQRGRGEREDQENDGLHGFCGAGGICRVTTSGRWSLASRQLLARWMCVPPRRTSGRRARLTMTKSTRLYSSVSAQW